MLAKVPVGCELVTNGSGFLYPPERCASVPEEALLRQPRSVLDVDVSTFMLPGLPLVLRLCSAIQESFKAMI